MTDKSAQADQGLVAELKAWRKRYRQANGQDHGENPGRSGDDQEEWHHEQNLVALGHVLEIESRIAATPAATWQGLAVKMVHFYEWQANDDPDTMAMPLMQSIMADVRRLAPGIARRHR